jgi:membrane glycosyltransferase
MSALGQKRTFAVQNGLSALPPKADIGGATRDVRFVPIADKRRRGWSVRYVPEVDVAPHVPEPT